MAVSNNIISFGSHHDKSNEQLSHHKKEIQACRKLVAESLPKCFEFLNNLDDSLFKLADQAETNQLQGDYFEIMRRFRVQKDSIKKQFSQLILSDFDAFWSQPLTKEKITKTGNSYSEDNLDSELSLMQNDELEEEIAIKRIEAKCDSILGNELRQLNSRFAHMLNTTSPIDNPLSISKIALHLQKVISPITSDISIKLVAYKQFEQHAIAEIVTLYQELNDDLIKQNILPKLSNKRRKSLPKTPATNNDRAASSNSFDDEDELEDSVIFDELRQLLGRAKHETSSIPANSASTANINTIISALSSLQQQANTQIKYDASGEITLPDLQQSLLSNLHQTRADGSVINQSISTIDEDTLNVIAFLFEFILEDRAIPSPIRTLLARLQLPMLKVAISDKSFFSKKSHAARVLLNNLAKVSTGWDHSNGMDDILFKQIESIVTTILTDFDTDITIFTILNKQLNQFTEQQEQNSDSTEKRITQTTEGQEKLIAAQQEVDVIIHQLLTQYSPVPKAVVTLIEDSWRQVLKLRFLQKGKDSPEWKTAVSLMEQLLWSVTPKTEPTERKKLLETIPQLLKSLREILSGASFNQPKITALFKDLQKCHIKCLNGNRLEQNELQKIEEHPQPSDVENVHEDLIPIPEEKKILSDDDALNAAKQLQVGTWLEVTQDEQSQRIKFSWRSNLTGRCLFVTYQGLKAAELAISELASWFQQGQAVILDQATKPLMDRALVSMKDTIDKQNHSEETELNI
ncbi:MAG: DUF1631 family protein [Methylophaga sp.]|nr:DUF1631 family protein [Methylophaga sp.]